MMRLKARIGIRPEEKVAFEKDPRAFEEAVKTNPAFGIWRFMGEPMQRFYDQVSLQRILRRAMDREQSLMAAMGVHTVWVGSFEDIPTILEAIPGSDS